MLAIKILTGQQMGKVLPIKEGASVIGRAPECDIILPSNNVSKKHAKFEKQGNLLVLTDLQSTNGSFVNGIKVESAKVHVGDRISFHDMILEVVGGGASASAGGGIVPYSGGGDNSLATADPQLTLVPQLQEEDIIQPYDPPVEVIKKKANQYMETVVLPGIYKLPEFLDFQWVIGGFFVLMVVISTSLSVVPLLRILKSSIEEASRRNVYNIVTEMTAKNKDALHKRIFSAVDIDETLKRQGVERAFITDVRGEIILPSRYAGKTPTFKNFHTGRKLAGSTTPYIEFTDPKNILGIQAIKYYDTKKSIETTRYYSVVLYNVDARMMDPNRTLSLFVQTLALSLVAALIMYFFVSRLISYPIRVLNKQIDHKLRTGEQVLQSPFQYKPLQKLYSNLNSALNRAPENDSGQQVFEYDRSREMKNIVELIGFPAVAIRAVDEIVEGYNPGFEERTGLSNLRGTGVGQIAEQSLKLCLQDLIERIKETPDDIVYNSDFDFNGEPYEIALQAIYGASEIAYYIITFIPVEAEG